KNRDKVVEEIEEIAGVGVEVLDEEEEGRFAFIGATKSLGHPVEGTVAVVDVGGGSSEVIYGTVPEGVTEVESFKIRSGSLPASPLESDPPSASEIRELRDHISDFFEKEELAQPDQAVAVGGSATSLRTLVGAVLEYETLERAVRVLTSDEIYEVAKRFELDSRRVKLLPAGVLLLEKFSEMLGRPLQIGKGGLREGIILTLLNGNRNGSAAKLAACRPKPRSQPPSARRSYLISLSPSSKTSSFGSVKRSRNHCESSRPPPLRPAPPKGAI